MKYFLSVFVCLFCVCICEGGLILKLDGADPCDTMPWQAAGSIGVSIEAVSSLQLYDLVVSIDSGPGTLDGSAVAFCGDFSNETCYSRSTSAASMSGVRYAGFGQPPLDGPVDILWAIGLNLTGVNNVVVTLRTAGTTQVDGVSLPVGRELDSFTIVPEPMVMSLLATGGLAYLRRRKS